MPNLATPRRAMPLLALALAGLTSACAPGEFREFTAGARELAGAASEVITASNSSRRDRSYQPSSFHPHAMQAPGPRYGYNPYAYNPYVYGRRF